MNDEEHRFYLQKTRNQLELIIILLICITFASIGSCTNTADIAQHTKK